MPIIFYTKQLIILVLLLLNSFGFGLTVLKLLFNDIFGDIKKNEVFLSSVVLGLGVFGHLLFIGGALKLYSRLSISIFTITSTVFYSIIFLIKLKNRWQGVIFGINLKKICTWYIVLTAVILLNSIYPLLAYAFIPPLWWDELAYHLAVPKIYLENNGIIYIPFIPYSNWPMEAEMLFTLGLVFKSETTSHLIEWTCFILTCWAIYLFGEKYFSKQVALIATATYTSTPIVYTLAGTAFIEHTLIMFVFMSTFYFFNWTQQNNNRDLMLSAIFGGLAASTKLNGALIPFVLGILIFIITLIKKKTYTEAGKMFCLYGLIAFVVVSPWYIKNWSHTGNPFWPFLLDIFGGKNWDSLGSEYLMGFIKKPNLPLTIINWLTGIGHLTFTPGEFGPPEFYIGFHYIIFLPLVILSVLQKSDYRKKLLLLVVIFTLYYTLWFFTTHQTRFLMFSFPILSLICAISFTEIKIISNDSIYNLLRFGIICVLLLNSWFARERNLNIVIASLPYLSGKINYHNYLKQRLPEYSVFHYVNKNIPSGSYFLLALYESRGYYLNHPYMWANPISQRVIKFEEFSNAKNLKDYLRTFGFTHIIYRPSGVERFTYIRYGDQITQTFKEMLSECRLIYKTTELEVYELVEK